MTAAEVIELAFTRNLDAGHILAADITVAREMYVNRYITDAPTTGTFYDDYIKPVIAFGVAVNVFERIATEITDRGVVEQTIQGTRIADVAGRRRIKGEYQQMLDELIYIMVDEAESEGYTTIDDDIERAQVQFTGRERMGVL